MTWWPWIGRGRLDDARDEIRTLRAQVESLQENVRALQGDLTRVVRHQSGMSETPRTERKKLERMPKRIHEYINSFANPSQKKFMRDELYRKHGRGTPWSEIEAELEEKENEREQTPQP